MEPTFAEAGLRLHLVTDPHAAIDGDPAQIAAVLVNLLENVLHHAGPGAEASVRVRRREQGVSLTVGDTGAGVPAAEASIELARHRGEVVPKDVLLERVWQYRFDPRTKIVETHVSRLRAKLTTPGLARPIVSLRNIGYRLDVGVEAPVGIGAR